MDIGVRESGDDVVLRGYIEEEILIERGRSVPGVFEGTRVIRIKVIVSRIGKKLRKVVSELRGTSEP